MLWNDIISTKSVLTDDILANKKLAVIDISNILKDFDSLLDSPYYMSPITYIHSSLSTDVPVLRLFNHLSPFNTKCNPITALFRPLSILNFLFINRLFFFLRPIRFLLRIFVFFIIINRLVSLILRKLSVFSLFLNSCPSPSLYRLSYYTYTLSLWSSLPIFMLTLIRFVLSTFVDTISYSTFYFISLILGYSSISNIRRR